MRLCGHAFNETDPCATTPLRRVELTRTNKAKASPRRFAYYTKQIVRINAKHLSEPPNWDVVASLGKCIQKTQFDLLMVRYLKVEA